VPGARVRVRSSTRRAACIRITVITTCSLLYVVDDRGAIHESKERLKQTVFTQLVKELFSGLVYVSRCCSPRADTHTGSALPRRLP